MYECRSWMTIEPPFSAGLMITDLSACRSLSARSSSVERFGDGDAGAVVERMWLLRFPMKLSIYKSLPGGGVQPEDGLKLVKESLLSGAGASMKCLSRNLRLKSSTSLRVWQVWLGLGMGQ